MPLDKEQPKRPQNPKKSQAAEVVNGQLSSHAHQGQIRSLQQRIADAETDVVLGEVAKNYAVAKLELTGYDLSHRPDLQATLDQSRQFRQQVEAMSPDFLSPEEVIDVIFGDVPALQGRLPAQEYRLLQAQPTTNQPPTNTAA